MKISPISAFNDNYIWLIVNKNTQAAIVVDPGTAKPVFKALNHNKLHLAAIFITHHHLDHTGGIKELQQKYSVPIYGPASEQIPLRTHGLKDGDHIRISALKTNFTIFDVPGHTSGHIAYYGENSLFCGDTLFTGGCGRLFEGTAQQMHQSLSKISCLPNETKIYCAHEYTLNNLKFAQQVEPENKTLQQRIKTTIQQRQQQLATVPATLWIEKKTNPFLRTHTNDVKTAAEQYAQRSLNSEIDVFSTIRKWKDNF